MRLFVQAAQRVEPALVPAVEAASIVDICRQVEGLPLALELAAAWTRVLSCDAIAAELRQGTELLHAVDAAHPARHASIEVVFDQSWRLLGAAERDALSRLSVFHGGFSPEAARAVAGAPLPVLGALADKSLLRKEESRIYLHPLVQQLAAARLGESDRRMPQHKRLTPRTFIGCWRNSSPWPKRAIVMALQRSMSSSRTAGARGLGRSSTSQAMR